MPGCECWSNTLPGNYTWTPTTWRRLSVSRLRPSLHRNTRCPSESIIVSSCVWHLECLHMLCVCVWGGGGGGGRHGGDRVQAVWGHHLTEIQVLVSPLLYFFVSDTWSACICSWGWGRVGGERHGGGGEGLGGGLVGGREEDWHMYSVTLLIRTV